ncbi:FG-GAP repeat protein [Aquisphaera giovannonii]|uniref:FG-GAP repeat protein n=1 Tax=Aquisphaera giovannonii TaxID=406548 RepID=A0A5B9W119_9BACT|nr:VCBS repeat-containing protein [Aquisphaera giovannonii]QEH33675.1 FG-GAP repeat protein [Aquisphaera giovannonii]
MDVTSKRRRHGRKAIALLATAAFLMPARGAFAQVPAPREAPRLAEYFGFLPLEIYKLERRISNLTVRDLDGDRVGDIIVGNNARSRIDLLLSGKRPAEEADGKPFRKETNELDFDKRMRGANIPVNKEIVSLDVGDFNGDGKPDIVYYGTPAEVEILYNEGEGRFSSGKKIATGEAVESANALAVGDIDRDGRDDIALLAENDLIFVYQTGAGTFSEPERVPHTGTGPRMLKLVDMDGNGALDLVILDGGTDHPVHIRFATDEKKLGPEQRFQVESPRAIAFGQIDGAGGQELLTIEAQSGRGRVLTLDDSANDEQNRWGRLIFFGLPQGSERGRSIAVGDLDGDKRRDVVVTDPANAQVWLYRQSARNGLNAGQSFPGLLGGKTVRLADLDRDGKDEVYVLSEQEKQVGRSTLANGRIGFPAPLPVVGDPIAMDLADLDGDGVPEVLTITKANAGKGDSFELRALKREPSGTFRPFRWGQTEVVSVASPTGAPVAIQGMDVNADRVTDLMIFTGYGSPSLLIGRKDAPPTPFTGSLGPMASATTAGLTLGNLNGPAILVAQTTFARRIRLDERGQWEIPEQYNSGRNSAQILGAAALDVDGDGTKEVVLYDRNSKSLLFLAQKDGGYRPAGTLSVGTLTFEGLHVADFDGDGREDLLIAGAERFGVLQTGRRGLRLKPIASFESKRNEARLSDLAAGDLNADGVPDVVFTDAAEGMIEIATYAGEPALLPAIGFKLFERKLYHANSDGAEPRDMTLGDVDGDGRADIVLIAHDRILVLRQDAGTGSKQPQASASAGPKR